ncbi:MAG TPA: alkyl sulfatase dimerization domain-containing protein [Blastocatellia bacterium]|nr:alkyl sulfatase dimerization domain-containing protein [Blastocatellia bacterium]
MLRKRAFALSLAALSLALCAPALAQDKDRPEIKVPVNPLLENHSNWFKPKKIYDLKQDHYPLKELPSDLSYEVYSAVGFDLANTIVIKGPKRRGDGERELIIVDTLGNPEVTRRTIEHFRSQNILPKGRLPIRAIIYTHNHIDHTFGVWGYLKEADRPPCLPADPDKAGPDSFYDADQEKPDCVTVIGQAQINEGVGTTALVTGTIIDARSSYMYGSFIPLNHVNDGIGMQEKAGFKLNDDPNADKKVEEVLGSYRMPSRTFTNWMTLKAAGVEMKLIYVPSETNDELAGFIPDQRNRVSRVPPSGDDWGGPGLLLSAEVIQGPSFPNLYSLRGTAYRNPAHWFRSVDKLRQLDSWCMVPSHGPPVCGRDNIQRLLMNFRDAVQFTHDQAIRWMNKGYTMDELAPLVEDLYLKSGEHQRLMSGLDGVQPILNSGSAQVVDPKDYLRPFYGSLVQAVREIYVGSVGWYQADPVALRPTPPKELAERYVKMMGGAARVNQAAQEAYDHKEFEWAAELTTNVIRAYTDLVPRADIAESPDKQATQKELKDARFIKAQAFKKLAEAEINPNWRNWYITSAHELMGWPLPDKIVGGLVSPGVVGALPGGAWVNSLTMRLRAERTAKQNVDTTLGFWFPAETAAGDQGFGPLGYVLHIRGGIAEFIEETPRGAPLSQQDVEKARLAISLNKAALNALLRAEARGEAEFRKALNEAVAAGLIKPLGTTSLDKFAEAFFGYFDPKPVGLPPLTVR